MKRRSTRLLLGALAALWMVPVPHAPAQAPTEEELKDFERQAEQLEKEQAAAKAEAKRKAEAAKKAAAADKAKRKAARKRAEERRGTEEARSTRPESDGRERATEAAAALAGELVDIPGGTFQMGCSPGDGECQDDERPAHTVSIKPFRMGKHEVTVGQFRQFVDAAGYRTDAERGGNCWAVQADGKAAEQAGRDWRNPGFPQSDRHPVVCVSWNDTQAYTQWLSQKGAGRYRLPSESEWEHATRAGGNGRYSFGDSEGMLCQYGNIADRRAQQRYNNWTVAPCDDGVLYTAPVGGYRPNGFGLNDMHGNVWEWTEDCYHDSYAGAPSDGAAWTGGECARRVARGGSWGSHPRFVRSSTRGGGSADARGTDLGFRLLQDH